MNNDDVIRPDWKWGTPEGSRELDRLLDRRLSFHEKVEWLEEAETLSSQMHATRQEQAQAQAPSSHLSLPSLLNWYCIHAAPRQENKVAQLLQRDLGIEVFAPRIRFRRMRAGQPLWATEALFPGYLFARFEYFERRRQINALPGVTTVVHFGDRVLPIDEAVMADLRALVQDNEIVEVTADPQPGSEVVITGGSLRGLRVLVTRVIPARQRIAILLELLGSQREVEIERDRVLPVNPRQQM